MFVVGLGCGYYRCLYFVSWFGIYFGVGVFGWLACRLRSVLGFVFDGLLVFCVLALFWIGLCVLLSGLVMGGGSCVLVGSLLCYSFLGL